MVWKQRGASTHPCPHLLIGRIKTTVESRVEVCNIYKILVVHIIYMF